MTRKQGKRLPDDARLAEFKTIALTVLNPSTVFIKGEKGGVVVRR